MIEVQNLTKHYGDRVAVNNINFTVRKGEVFAFLGPNGSGKTTTMKSIVGLNIPTKGRVLINSVDTQRFPRETRRFVSYLPQRVVFPENLTAREIVRFYGRLRKLHDERAEEILTRNDFALVSDRPVGEFSGGMIQRLGLAVVTLPDAPIMLLDEPTANLDPQGVKLFREFLLRQKEAGKTIIFSTHLLSEVEQLADRAGIFVSGNLVAEESIDSLRRSFRANRTIEDMYLEYVGAAGNG